MELDVFKPFLVDKLLVERAAVGASAPQGLTGELPGEESYQSLFTNRNPGGFVQSMKTFGAKALTGAKGLVAAGVLGVGAYGVAQVPGGDLLATAVGLAAVGALWMTQNRVMQSAPEAEEVAAKEIYDDLKKKIRNSGRDKQAIKASLSQLTHLVQNTLDAMKTIRKDVADEQDLGDKLNDELYVLANRAHQMLLPFRQPVSVVYYDALKRVIQVRKEVAAPKVYLPKFAAVKSDGEVQKLYSSRRFERIKQHGQAAAKFTALAGKSLAAGAAAGLIVVGASYIPGGEILASLAPLAGLGVTSGGLVYAYKQMKNCYRNTEVVVIEEMVKAFKEKLDDLKVEPEVRQEAVEQLGKLYRHTNKAMNAYRAADLQEADLKGKFDLELDLFRRSAEAILAKASESAVINMVSKDQIADEDEDFTNANNNEGFKFTSKSYIDGENPYSDLTACWV